MLSFFKSTPEALVRRLKNLPPTPKILRSLEWLVAQPEATLQQVADLVQLEPGLAAHVVRMARSTHFGRGAQVDGLMEAVQRVGVKGVKELVTFAVTSQLVGRPLAIYNLNAQQLWNQAIACALAAANLAEKSPDVDYEAAYTAGLMHGIGLLVFDGHAVTQKQPPNLTSVGYPEDFAADERAWLGFSNADAGAALLDLWGFPSAVATAVRYQLNPQDAPSDRKLCMILAVARWARSLLCGADQSLPEIPDKAWLAESGISPEEFGDWLARVRFRYSVTCSELKLGQNAA